MSEFNVCEIVLQEGVYGHYFLKYVGVIYVLAFSGRNFFNWDAAYYELQLQDFVHITDVYFSDSAWWVRNF